MSTNENAKRPDVERIIFACQERAADKSPRDSDCINRELQMELCNWILHLESQLQAAECQRLRRAIESFGNTPEFDWNVLGKIDEQEREIERLKSELTQQRTLTSAEVEALRDALDESRTLALLHDDDVTLAKIEVSLSLPIFTATAEGGAV